MNQEEARELWDRVVRNENALKTCKRHAFVRDVTPDRTFSKKWQCSRCGGEVNSTQKWWYELGLEHAGRS